MCNYNKIHSFLLRQSNDFPYLNDIFRQNGTMIIRKEKIQFFDFVFKTIISQQISYKASESIWRKIENSILKNNINLVESINDKEVCSQIRKFGVSSKKMEYILGIKRNSPDINSKIKYYRGLSANNFKKIFKKNRGVGDWTCDMIQIFYFRNLNIWPNSDLIIKKVLHKIKEKEVKLLDFKKNFEPYLSIVALQFWKFAD